MIEAFEAKCERVAETRLETITRHVLGAREIVERQRRLVTIQKANGHDTEMAKDLLERVERTLAIFERELIEAKNPPQSE